MEKDLTQNNKDKWIWKRPGAYKILELVKQGRSMPEITKIVKWREDTVWHFMSSPTFLQKLEEHLKCVFFNFQKNRILALEEVSKYLWDIAMGRKVAEGISPERAFDHLIKLLAIKRTPEISNPQQFNIIMNLSKSPEAKSQRDLAKEFGFEHLLKTEEDKEELDSQIE